MLPICFPKARHSRVSGPAGYLEHLLLKGFLYRHACPSICKPLDTVSPGCCLPLSVLPVSSLHRSLEFQQCVSVSLSGPPYPGPSLRRLWVSPGPQTQPRLTSVALRDHIPNFPPLLTPRHQGIISKTPTCSLHIPTLKILRPPACRRASLDPCIQGLKQHRNSLVEKGTLSSFKQAYLKDSLHRMVGRL